MKYLKTIILENFQSHKYTIINFDEGLNVIVGPSDTGKSAIIRAIKWALYNEPSGDYFIRKGEKAAAVTLIFNDNTKIKRYRSNSKNQYILYDNLGEEIKYEGFGLGVPKEIIEKIGIEKIYLDSEETNSINLGEQLEGAFLLSEKSSTRASAIGRLIGVNIIDDSLKDTLKDLRNFSIEKKNKDLDIASIGEELKTFDYLEGLNIRLNKLEKIKEKIKFKEKNKEILIKLNLKYIKFRKELKILEFYLEKLDGIDYLEKIINQIELLNRDNKYYNMTKDKIKSYRYKIHNNKLLIKKLNGIKRISEIENNLVKKIELKNKLSKIKIKSKSLNLELKRLDENLYKLKSIYKIQIIVNDSNIAIDYLKQLENLNIKYKSNQNSLQKGEKYIQKFKSIDIIYNNYRLLEKNILKIIKLLDERDLLNKTKKLIYNEKENYKEVDLKIQKILNKYKAILKQNEVCPLCLSIIDDAKLNHIVEHLK